ncbi:hypothetical protein GF367_00685 [Candidatus Woesearchaeota archaeon]|nr:hypothetical protein [Candidatus Woesearchaeota archaeon]
MHDLSLNNKVAAAEEMLTREKEFVLQCLEEGIEGFQPDRCFFPLYEEETKYAIRDLDLYRSQQQKNND